VSVTMDSHAVPWCCRIGLVDRARVCSLSSIIGIGVIMICSLFWICVFGPQYTDFANVLKQFVAASRWILLVTTRIHLPLSSVCREEWIELNNPELHISFLMVVDLISSFPFTRLALIGFIMASRVIPMMGRIAVWDIWSLCHLMILGNVRSLGVML
jgi:hypothetical protein